MIDSLRHFLIPQESNNHRAASLGFKALALYLGLFLLIQIGLEATPKWPGKILSYATNVNATDLLKFTNERRLSNGLSPVSLNDKLSEAASLKAQNMFAEQYWAHTSPSGKDPWSFVNQVNYSYIYAGENLARDFADSSSVVDAWMNSPSHKENLLNGKYQEVGFAVVNGKYGDYETTVIVQMFGAKSVAAPSLTPPAAVALKPSLPLPAVNSAADQTVPSIENPTPVLRPESPSLGFDLSNSQITKSLSVALLAILMVILAVDALVAFRTKPIRFVGHNAAHFLLISTLIVAILSIRRGLIL